MPREIEAVRRAAEQSAARQGIFDFVIRVRPKFVSSINRRAFTCNHNFPGTDRATSDGFARDVATDEKAMIDAISDLRHKQSSSLEAIGYLMGADPAQLSCYLKGTRSTTLTNYIRIARALGYRSRLLLEKADAGAPSILSDLKIVPHQVRRIQRGGAKEK